MLSSYTVALIYVKVHILKKKSIKEKYNLKHFFEIKKNVKLYMFSTAKSVDRFNIEIKNQTNPC